MLLCFEYWRLRNIHFVVFYFILIKSPQWHTKHIGKHIEHQSLVYPKVLSSTPSLWPQISNFDNLLVCYLLDMGIITTQNMTESLNVTLDS